MARYNIETLKARRERRCDVFTRKAWLSPRFGPKWFPRREPIAWNIRNRREVREVKAKRRYNSPLAYLKRRANDLRLTSNLTER